MTSWGPVTVTATAGGLHFEFVNVEHHRKDPHGQILEDHRVTGTRGLGLRTSPPRFALTTGSQMPTARTSENDFQAWSLMSKSRMVVKNYLPLGFCRRTRLAAG